MNRKKNLFDIFPKKSAIFSENVHKNIFRRGPKKLLKIHEVLEEVLFLINHTWSGGPLTTCLKRSGS